MKLIFLTKERKKERKKGTLVKTMMSRKYGHEVVSQMLADCFEGKSHYSTRGRSCKETTKLPLWWKAERFTVGVQRATLNGINCWRLIEEKAVDEIRHLGNKRNNDINSIFAETWPSWRLVVVLISKQEGIPLKEPRTRFVDNQILSHLCCSNKLELRINITHGEYLVGLSEEGWLWTQNNRRKIGARFRDILLHIYREWNIEITKFIF